MAKAHHNVRFSEEQLVELKNLAATNGVEVSQLIRWAVEALIRHAERNGGRLLLPLNFGETYELVQNEHPPALRAAEKSGDYKGKRASA